MHAESINDCNMKYIMVNTVYLLIRIHGRSIFFSILCARKHENDDVDSAEEPVLCTVISYICIVLDFT